ncbi:uncharacterized protein FA14DRAFT_160382 [Meira miltonrushii]|uniref:Uncharacterized protein n=1 Tax=Meira miltonrushii TaxID=1280837 RepID=A0A316VHS1_9BASI|nr:uncharacterized protein FA14DRAFT_160382 [Meira miltonrushii]PWN35055.1 hypothetical protein FA14DRAFT_160382 [Meira miltonrushii]
MAMPRYKYAIGNAPVRFPSLSSQNTEGQEGGSKVAEEAVQQEDTKTDPITTTTEARPKRWSFLFGGSSEPEPTSIKKTLSHQDLRKGSDSSTMSSKDDSTVTSMQRTSTSQSDTLTNDRQRSKSMHAPGSTLAPVPTVPDHARPQRQVRSSLYSPRIDGETRRSKRVSWVVPSTSTSRESSRANSVRSGVEANEQTGLLGDMSQRQASQRPLSATFRPSSLFWTDIERRGSDGGQAGNESGTSTPRIPSRSASPAPRRYGATEDQSVETPDEDDPYGYRALAGPALLPTFHERQKSKQAAASRSSSTLSAFTPTCSSTSWISLLGLSIIVTGLLYLLL